MIKLILAISLVLMSANVSAQDWKDLYLDGNATRVGAVYAATCVACYGGRYNDDRSAGIWQCTDAPQDEETPCLDALMQALTNRYQGN